MISVKKNLLTVLNNLNK